MKKDKIIKIRLILFCVAFLSLAFFVLYQIYCQKAENQKWDRVLSGGDARQLSVEGSCFGIFDIYISIALFALIFIISISSLIIAVRNREIKLDELAKESPLLVAYSGGYYGIEYATIPFIKVSLYNDSIVVTGFEKSVKIFYKDIIKFDVKINEYMDKIFKKSINLFPWPINIIVNLFRNFGMTKLEIEFMDNDTQKSIILYPLKVARIEELLKIKM